MKLSQLLRLAEFLNPNVKTTELEPPTIELQCLNCGQKILGTTQELKPFCPDCGLAIEMPSYGSKPRMRELLDMERARKDKPGLGTLETNQPTRATTTKQPAHGEPHNFDNAPRRRGRM